MKVGITLYSSFSFTPIELDSIKHVAKSLSDAITSRHELVFLPPAYSYATREDSRRMCEEFVRSCDVIVGCPSGQLPATRRRIGSSVPMVGLLLGVLPRGGWGLDVQVPHLTTGDVLVANCSADLELARKFLPNATARVVPFAYDERVYHAVDAEERKALRGRLGLREEDRVLVYAGRITLQKNVHTLLRVFSAVQRMVPDALLLIAGPTVEHGSPEFGVEPVNLANTVRTLIARLGIPGDRVRVYGGVAPDTLRGVYNVADAKVNMTLHHDENFGLSQVEAMACGAPVVGTAWGGLKDTIVDGVSGYKVSTSVTPVGIKVNWWEAVNRIVSLLRDPAGRERLRESCIRHATESYSQARYQAAVLETLEAAVEGSRRPAEPLLASDFARELWSTCSPSNVPPYRRGHRSYELYRELMEPVAARSGEQVAGGAPLDARQVVCLASPIAGDGQGGFGIDDPMYPFDLEVPEAFREAFEAILAVVREEPAATVERLSGTVAGRPLVPDTLAWMLETGLLLRTEPVSGWAAPERIDRRMGEPLFRIQRLDRMSTDFIVY